MHFRQYFSLEEHLPNSGLENDYRIDFCLVFRRKSSFTYEYDACVTEEQHKKHGGHYEMTARHRYVLLFRASCDDQVKTRASGFCYSSGRVY